MANGANVVVRGIGKSIVARVLPRVAQSSVSNATKCNQIVRGFALCFSDLKIYPAHRRPLAHNLWNFLAADVQIQSR